MGIIHFYNLTKRQKKYMLKSWTWKEPKMILLHFINEKTETTIKKILFSQR